MVAQSKLSLPKSSCTDSSVTNLFLSLVVVIVIQIWFYLDHFPDTISYAAV